MALPALIGQGRCQSRASAYRQRSSSGPASPGRAPLLGTLTAGSGVWSAALPGSVAARPAAPRCRRAGSGGAVVRAEPEAAAGAAAARPFAAADGGESDVRRVPVAVGGAGDAAAVLAQLLPGLRAGVPGLGRGRPPAAAAAEPGPGPSRPRGAGAGAGPVLRPGALSSVPEAVPAAPRRRGRPARQHHPGRGGQALPVRSGGRRHGRGGGAGAEAGIRPAVPAGVRGKLPETSEPAGAALLPHVPAGGVRAVRLRGAPGHLPLCEPHRHGVPGRKSKRGAPPPLWSLAGRLGCPPPGAGCFYSETREKPGQERGLCCFGAVRGCW